MKEETDKIKSDCGFEEPENTLISVITFCADDLFDWLSLKELAALNSTCKQLQQITSEYFHRKYPMKTMKVIQLSGINDIYYRSSDKSMQRFKNMVRNLVIMPTTECLQYLQTNHTKDLVSIAFYDGEFTDSAIDATAKLIENVEIVEIQYGSIHGEFYRSILQYCKRIKQLVIKYGFNECEHNGIENRWLLEKYPTLEHFHWSKTPLPDNFETFFHLNPQITSFNGSVYPTMSTILFLIQTGIRIDELHIDIILELHEDEIDGLTVVRSHLNQLHANKQFKSLMLQFMFCSQFLDPKWSQLEYLNGIYVDFPNQYGATRALSMLIHLKLLVLGINTTLSRAKASILAKQLINLEEIYIQINTIHAITPFLRNAKKLNKIYVYGTGLAKEFSGKFKMNHISALNEDRMKLCDACKTTVFLPDNVYVQMKCKLIVLNYSLIEIKRSESHILKHPFAASIIRRDICELYEKF